MSLEADFPDSRSAVDSIEGCTVSTVSVSGLTTRTSRRGHKKIREAVITDTKATDTATTEQEAVGAVAMIVQLQGLRGYVAQQQRSNTLRSSLGIKPSVCCVLLTLNVSLYSS